MAACVCPNCGQPLTVVRAPEGAPVGKQAPAPKRTKLDEIREAFKPYSTLVEVESGTDGEIDIVQRDYVDGDKWGELNEIAKRFGLKFVRGQKRWASC